MPFRNKRVLLTGGAGEVGARVAGQLVMEGADVSMIGLKAPVGTPNDFLACDLSDQADLDRAVDWVAARDWDILINLAGVQHFGPFEHEPAWHLTRTFMINLVAPARLAQAVLPSMRTHGRGQIANVGSVLGSINHAHFATYSASKAGLRGFSQALRRELAGTGIAVTYVAPRAVRTRFNSAKLLEFASLTGMAMDDPAVAAVRIVEAIAQRRREVHIGWPEALFARLNAVAPSLIDRALAPRDRRAAKLFPRLPAA